VPQPCPRAITLQHHPPAVGCRWRGTTPCPARRGARHAHPADEPKQVGGSCAPPATLSGQPATWSVGRASRVPTPPWRPSHAAPRPGWATEGRRRPWRTSERKSSRRDAEGRQRKPARNVTTTRAWSAIPKCRMLQHPSTRHFNAEPCLPHARTRSLASRNRSRDQGSSGRNEHGTPSLRNAMRAN